MGTSIVPPLLAGQVTSEASQLGPDTSKHRLETSQLRRLAKDSALLADTRGWVKSSRNSALTLPLRTVMGKGAGRRSISDKWGGRGREEGTGSKALPYLPPPSEMEKLGTRRSQPGWGEAV